MKNKCGCPVCSVVGLLVIIGALNWGLVGAFNINLVIKLFGMGTTGEKVAYIVIGIAAIVKLLSCFITCPCAKKCEPKPGS